jgi:peptide chain release factor 3
LKNSEIDTKKLNLTSSSLIVNDKKNRPALIFENEWSIQWAKDKNSGLELLDII